MSLRERAASLTNLQPRQWCSALKTMESVMRHVFLPTPKIVWPSRPARGRGRRKRERYRAIRREKMSQALDGIRVIDFTHDQAGPSCTQMLAWLGADVIKIERPPHGDRARRLWATPDDPADSYFFLLLNSNKRSIVVDLKTVEGKDIARRLVREADVIAENLGPGVMERLGLGYERSRC
ncbi:MAG: hypothetical protein DME00_26285 [Candidatus Rokuibacteriota bacterium]|nr:MAG: hypothetical protein DME00_26285 [Candidatus Rokubacteria bacterium]